jgi:hypothetical protein
MLISSSVQTPSLFRMVRVSGAANFHMHHNNTFGIQHIIIIGQIIFLGNLIMQLPIYLLSLCANTATDIHCHYYYGKCKPWNWQYLIKVCLTAVHSGIRWTIIKIYGNVKSIENFQNSKKKKKKTQPNPIFSVVEKETGWMYLSPKTPKF